MRVLSYFRTGKAGVGGEAGLGIGLNGLGPVMEAGEAGETGEAGAEGAEGALAVGSAADDGAGAFMGPQTSALRSNPRSPQACTSCPISLLTLSSNSAARLEWYKRSRWALAISACLSGEVAYGMAGGAGADGGAGVAVEAGAGVGTGFGFGTSCAHNDRQTPVPARNNLNRITGVYQ